MSILQSVIMDPVYHSNKRTEFKLYNKGRVFQPNLRLANFGVSDVVTAAETVNFSRSGGLYSLIKNISLYFNDILVDQVKDASKYLSIQNLAQPIYTVFRNMNNQTVCSNIILDKDADDMTTLELDEVSNKVVGYVKLTDVFPLLKTMLSGRVVGDTVQAYPLADISEIRVSIEYETDVNKIFCEPQPQGFTVSQPQIIYTEIVGASVKDTSSVISFYAIENERFMLNATANKQSIRLRAFDGKIVSSLLFQNIPNNDEDPKLCLQYSQSLENEKVNLMINNNTYLPFQGVDNECKKLVYATNSSALGFHFSPTGAAMVDTEPFAQYGEELADLIGKISFLGVNVNRLISRIDYEVSFDGAQPVTVYCYGLVSKVLSRVGDKFMTSYTKLSK